jgi:hypothetical protein
MQSKPTHEVLDKVLGQAESYLFLPPSWFVARPGTYEEIDLSKTHDAVYRHDLPVGISAKVIRYGLISFEFSKWAEGRPRLSQGGDLPDLLTDVRAHRLTVINSHLICLYTSLVRRQNWLLDKRVVSHHDLLHSMDLDSPNFVVEGDPFRIMNIPANYAAKLPEKDTTEYQKAQDDWRHENIRRDTVIEMDALEDSFDLLSDLLKPSNDHILVLTDLIAHSCNAFEEKNYELCLVASWAIIENLLNLLWNRVIQDGKASGNDSKMIVTINANRERRLKDGRSFTASVIHETLTFLKIITVDTNERVSQVRKSRNDWMHNLLPVKRQDARLSIDVAQEMLKIALSIEFALLFL